MHFLNGGLCHCPLYRFRKPYNKIAQRFGKGYNNIFTTCGQPTNVVECGPEVVLVDDAVLVDVHELEDLLVHDDLLLGEATAAGTSGTATPSITATHVDFVKREGERKSRKGTNLKSINAHVL